jgi:hypothetical protein
MLYDIVDALSLSSPFPPSLSYMFVTENSYKHVLHLSLYMIMLIFMYIFIFWIYVPCMRGNM